MAGHAAGMRRQAVLVTVVASLMLAFGASPAAHADDWTFVQVQRVNSLALQFGTDAYAPSNAFGGAFGSAAQASVESALASGVADGSITWLLEMPGLTDLSGTSNASFDLGVVGGTPVQPAGNPATYDGNSDLDWWYVPTPADLEPDGSATHKLTASFTTRTLEGTGGSLALTINLFGTAATLAMSSTHIQAHADDSSAPLKSTNGFPPGHVPGENLPDSLTSFESMSSAKLTGRISARSMYNTPVPAAIAQQCTNYDVSHTMLDLLVGGCTVVVVQVVKPTQPDTFDPAVGSGTYTFTFNSTTHRVTGCTHDAAPASLDDCLDQAAYSAYFQFTTDRVIDQNQVTVRKLLTVNRAGPGSGTVTSSPVGIDCGNDCVHGYTAGAQVALTASPAAGSRFDSWTACDNPSGTTCEMTMDADKSVQATFTADASAGPGGAGDGGGTTPADATPADSTPAGGDGTTSAVDKTPPAFGSATISPRKVRKRATVKFNLSEAAQVTFVFESAAPGRRVRAKCVKPTRANARKRHCDRFVPVARLTATALAGANQKVFATRIGKRKLKPGKYRLTLRATDAAGNESQPKRLTFVVK